MLDYINSFDTHGGHYAVNVRIYNLNLTKKQKDVAMEIVSDENLSDYVYAVLNSMLRRWNENGRLKIYGAGRSGGWLELYGTEYVDECSSDESIEQLYNNLRAFQCAVDEQINTFKEFCNMRVVSDKKRITRTVTIKKLIE